MHQQQNLSAAHIPAFHHMCLLFQEETALEEARRLSDELGNTILLKREDLQPVHSFKVRGAFNRMSQMTDVQMQKGVICASAGNHAQGVALAALKLVSHLPILYIVVNPKCVCNLQQLMTLVLQPLALFKTPRALLLDSVPIMRPKGQIRLGNHTGSPHM